MCVGECITNIVQSEPDGWTVVLGLVPSSIAILIAVAGFLIDGHIRRKDKKDRETELAAAEERRALRDAQKVVWVHRNLEDGTSVITITNAGSGPILGVALQSARRTPKGDDVYWMSADDSSPNTPVILSGQTHDFFGSWVRRLGYENAPIAPSERPTQSVLCELLWTDDSGHNWDTDNEFAQVHLRSVIGAEERSYIDPKPAKQYESNGGR